MRVGTGWVQLYYPSHMLLHSQQDRGEGAAEASQGGQPNPTLSPSKALCPPGWTGTEVTYFTMLHPLFGHNYCSMAELIGTKTCHEVYQYAQLATGDALPGQGVGQSVGKKKKKNMRLVSLVT